jgi:biotin carboxyl carrier protein
MPQKPTGDSSESVKAVESFQAKASTPGDGRGTLHVAPRRAEELPGVNQKMEQAANLFAEVGAYLEKAAPQHKRLLDEVRMKLSDVGVLLQQMDDDDVCGLQRIVAPMPGVIMRCDKKVGQSARKGELLLILDAMKMENLITSPVDGKIASLPFAEGQKVAKGSVLAVISVRNDRDLSVAR